jgi:hypothetical protein
VKKIIFLSALSLLVPAVVCLAQVKQTTDIFIANQDGQVKFKAVDGTMTTTTLPWLEFTDGTNAVFQVPYTGILPVIYGGTGSGTASGSKTALGIQAGWTNTSATGQAIIKFSTAFSTAPAVVITPTITNITFYVTNVTTSLATVYLSSTNAFYWIAIGAP